MAQVDFKVWAPVSLLPTMDDCVQPEASSKIQI